MRESEALAKLEEYWKQATAFAAKNSGWFVIDRDMGEHLHAWQRYFNHRLPVSPVGMGWLRAGKINTFLTPCEWPEWFDPSWGAKKDDKLTSDVL